MAQSDGADYERRLRGGGWLREQREARGLTVRAMGRAIGLDSSQVSNYENGKSAIDDRRAKQIADVLQLPLLAVRRGLGLWVPDEPEGRRPITVDEFIAQDTQLSPEAKRHYRAQYDLLTRLMPTLPADLDEQERSIAESLMRRGFLPDPAVDAARKVVAQRPPASDEDEQAAG